MRRGRRAAGAADRRLVDARQRTDLRDERPGRGRLGPVRLQLLGREVPPVRQGRARARAAGRGPGRPSLRRADDPGGWVVLRGRRGHAAHDGGVPSESEPEPRPVAGADRDRPARSPGGGRDRVAAARDGRRPRHRRAHRRRGADRATRDRDVAAAQGVWGPGRAARGRERRTLGVGGGCARPLAGGARGPGDRGRRGGGLRAGGHPVPELLPGERRRSRADRRHSAG
jgi:hypothetical protein